MVIYSVQPAYIYIYIYKCEGKTLLYTTSSFMHLQSSGILYIYYIYIYVYVYMYIYIYDMYHVIVLTSRLFCKNKSNDVQFVWASYLLDTRGWDLNCSSEYWHSSKRLVFRSRNTVYRNLVHIFFRSCYGSSGQFHDVMNALLSQDECKNSSQFPKDIQNLVRNLVKQHFIYVFLTLWVS